MTVHRSSASCFQHRLTRLVPLLLRGLAREPANVCILLPLSQGIRRFRSTPGHYGVPTFITTCPSPCGPAPVTIGACCGRTIKSGNLVPSRTRSVTLPVTQRCKPPRPCVAIAIRLQPWHVPSAFPNSAASISAAAISLLDSTDQVTFTLYSAAMPLLNLPATAAR